MNPLRSVLAAVVMTSLVAAPAGAQTLSELASWDALMLSSPGSFPPAGRLFPDEATGGGVAIRFGEWRFNKDDAVHSNYGVTLTHSFPNGATASVTGAYFHTACVGCAQWQGLGADLTTVLWHWEFGRDSTPWARTGIGGRLSGAGAQVTSHPVSIARSGSLTIPLVLEIRRGAGRWVRGSLTPGIGYGKIFAPDGDDGGWSHMMGAALASDLTRWLEFSLGAQKIFITGGPIELGASFTWIHR